VTKVAGLPITDAGSRLFGRQVFAGAIEVELDRQGRLLIPAYLREETGLVDEAVVIGSRDHLEVWSPARWTEYRRAMDDPEAFARAIQGLGI
jgi:MraZ protein